MKLTDFPDSHGHFGPYGGVFVAETLMAALDELRIEYEKARNDPAFIAEFEYELKHYVGRPSPVYHAKRLSEQYGGAQIYLKREDLNHTGAHKINNTIGQALLARRMGKKRVIAETGAGQHGVASATVAARYGMECVVYMGAEDVAAPVAQRLPHEAARRDRGAGVVRFQNPEGRAQRSDARLGHQRRIHFLHPRHRCRPASLSHAGARLPVRDRPRSHRANAGTGRPPARLRGRLRRRRLECHRHFLSLSGASRREADRRRSGRFRHRLRQTRRAAVRRQRPASCTASAAI